MSKEFRFKERARVELRLDTFNTLNHTQFDTVNSTLNVTRKLRGPFLFDGFACAAKGRHQAEKSSDA